MAKEKNTGKENSEIKFSNSDLGEVRIADSVVASIALLAAKETDGVVDAVGNTAKELMSIVGMKSAKGVRVEIIDDVVSVELALIIKYGFNIPSICKEVQSKVSSTIESMTGLTVSDVNIRIAGMNI